MTKEEQMLENRFLELAQAVYRKGIPLYTDFLTLYEQDLFYKTKLKLPPVYSGLSGGNSLAERKIAVFLPYEDYPGASLPVSVLKMSPVNLKFSEELSHRDYLGALMNLGIERSVLGDILIDGTTAYLYCKENLSKYIMEKLVLVRHTNISVSQVTEAVSVEPKFEEITGSISAPRLDCILPLAFQGSRSKLCGLIEGKKVFVNSRLAESNSLLLKDGDLVSVRGYGKFRYNEQIGTTKKGRAYVSLYKYI